MQVRVKNLAGQFIGQIMMARFNFVPQGWALCDGQLLPISQNNAQFSQLCAEYCADGRPFRFLNLRGRVPVYPGIRPGRSPRPLG